MLKEFKEFAMRGNVMDLAVAVVIGAAFGKIITSLVQDIMMPPIGLLLRNVNFADLFVTLNGQHFDHLADAQKVGAPTINYGLFINSIIDFLIVAFCIFLVIRQINRWTKKPEPAAVPTTKECPECATQIPIKAKKCPNCTADLARVGVRA